jgi:hypothetical protein
MKLSLIIVFIGAFLLACSDNKKARDTARFVDTVDASKGIHLADSLDLF